MGPAVLCAQAQQFSGFAQSAPAAPVAVPAQIVPVLPQLPSNNVIGTAAVDKWMPVLKTLSQQPNVMHGLDISKFHVAVAFLGALQHTDIRPDKELADAQPSSIAGILRIKLAVRIEELASRARAAKKHAGQSDSAAWLAKHEKKLAELKEEASNFVAIAPFFHEDQRAMIQEANDTFHEIVLPKTEEINALHEAAGMDEQWAEHLERVASQMPSPKQLAAQKAAGSLAAASPWLPIVEALPKHAGKVMLGLDLSQPKLAAAFIRALERTGIQPTKDLADVAPQYLAPSLRGKLGEYIRDVLMRRMNELSPFKETDLYAQRAAEIAAAAADLALISPFFHEDERAAIQKLNFIVHKVLLPNAEKLKAKALQEHSQTDEEWAEHLMRVAAQMPSPEEFKAIEKAAGAAFGDILPWLPVVQKLSQYSGYNLPKLDLSQPPMIVAFTRALARTNLNPRQIPAQISDNDLAALLVKKLMEHAKTVCVRVEKAKHSTQGKTFAAYEQEVSDLQTQVSELVLIAPFFYKGTRSMIRKADDTLHDVVLPMAANIKAIREPAPIAPMPKSLFDSLHKTEEPKPLAFTDEEFAELLGHLIGFPEGFATLGRAALTPRQKEKVRLLFLDSPDPVLRYAVFRVFQDSAFGYGTRDMVQWLYPEYARELFQLYPGLLSVEFGDDNKNFAKSLLSDPALLQTWIENMHALKNLSPKRYEALKAYSAKDKWASQARFAFFIARDRFKDYSLGSYYYLPYVLKDADAEVLAPDEPELITAALRVPDPKKAGALKQRYGLFDRLINANFQVLESMSSHAADMTRFAAKRILKRTGRMAELFARMKPEGDRSEDAKNGYSGVERRLRKRWADLQPDDALPEALVKRMFTLDASNPRSRLHSLINWLHQKALQLIGKAGEDVSDYSGRIEQRDLDYYLNFSYLGEAPLYEVLRKNPALKALWSRLSSIKDIGSDTFLLSEDRLWLHAHLGCHSAELFADVSDPDEGGMLRIRYKESGYDGSGMRIALIASFLKQLGIPSEIIGDSFLTVSWDKDHGLSSQRSLVEAYPFVVQLLRDLDDMDLTLGHLMDHIGAEETLKLAQRAGVIYAAEGGWPFKFSGWTSFEEGVEDYEKNEPQRKALAGELNEELERLNLPPIPEELPFGQRTIERFFTQPIEEAAARGQLDWNRSAAPELRAYAPVDALAQAVLSDAAQSAAKTAAALGTLEDSVLDYEPIGKIGSLSVERAQLRMDDGSILSVHALREPASGSLAYARAALWKAETGRVFLGAEGLVQLFRKNGYSIQSGEPLSVPQQEHLQTLLKTRIAQQPLEQPEAMGLPASPGRGESVVGPIIFDKTSRVEGGILTVPYTDPDDIEEISKAAGVLTTGGGSLSHAAITTRELGLPSVILYSAHWKNDLQGKPVLGLRLNKPSPIHAAKGGLQSVELHHVKNAALREGDLVRMNGRTGQVLLLERAGDGPMQKAYRALESLRTGASQELEWMQEWPSAVERFLLQEAQEDARYSGVQAKILEGLRNHAAHLTQEERQSFEVQAPPKDATSASPETKVRKPLWARLEKHLERLVRVGEESASDPEQSPQPDNRRDRLMALLRRMIRRDGAQAGSDPAYSRLLELDRKARDEKLQEKTSAEPAFLDLADIDDDMKPLVGGKSAKLGEMLQALTGQAAYVPEGLALTIHAYKRFLKETGLEDKVRALAMELDALLNAPGMDESGRSKEISRLSERIRQVLMSAKLDAEKGVGRDILEALKKHGFEDQAARWSVRSSAIQEDSDDAAFAGAAESYLNLKPDEILSKVVENWASFWLPRGILYRQRQGLRSVDLLPATLIQKMAPAVVSGVIFTRNPVNGKDEVVLNAAYGLGEGVVSGKAAADVYVTRKWDGQETELPHIARKRRRVENRPEGFGTRLGPVPAALRSLRALSLDQTQRLTRVAAALEKRFGKAMDIEFSLLADGTIVILQARPITTR
jgi:phosphoenolpyruvate synthase/pyruvate phosphate dikinase